MKRIVTTEGFAIWLDELKDIRGRARIQVRIKRLAAGNPGHQRNLKNGVSELKVDVGPGYRIYYLDRGNELVVLLCGGDKSTQSQDIQRAYELVLGLEA
ncbi:MAG: type II toxin-antitoxin system RelE/ParE family toxin [Gammaproteobacteria bacterium]